MDPLTALALNDTLGTEDHAVLVRLREGLENRLDLFPAKLLGGLLANRGEDLVCVVMVVVVVMTSAAAMLVVVVVMMLVVVVTVATALAFLVVIVVVMLVVVMTVATALALLVVIVVVMLVIVVTVTTALALLVVIVVMVMMFVVMVVLLFKSVHSILEGILMLHSKKNILTVKAIPGGSHDNGGLIMLTEERYALGDLLILCSLGMRKNDGGCVGDLIVIELAKVLHIHLALINVCNGGEAIKHRTVVLGGLCRTNNVRKLANARGLDNNSVGIILLKNLYKRLGEITNKRAADTARVHLGDLNARICKEAAVNTDLAKLVLDKHDLLACICLFDQLLNQRGLTRTEEA